VARVPKKRLQSKHPKTPERGHTQSRAFKQEWERLYRTAVLEFDQSRLDERIEDARSAILARARILTKETTGHEKEQNAIARALYILELLHKAGPTP
jgi:hypothetical protein